ncbi:MAG: short-chain dehydrogenase [Ilumatobacteraceae bacterium]|nr:short-chain dehydrogenase [Ilumatobacteraceae bacterium]
MSRVAVVTGGASGIGRSVAQRFAESGYRVAAFDVQADLVASAVAELGVSGYVVDVGDRESVDRAVAAVRSDLGPIEVLVTSAGIDGFANFTEITVEAWERVLHVNLTGTFHCIQAIIPDMIAANWGRIVTISSASAQMGAPQRAHYVASKGGIIALTKALAVEYSRNGITVNTIPPSVVDTPMARAGEASGELPVPLDMVAQMTPVGRLGVGEDIAAACQYLCSDEAGFVTGQQIGVNGGWYL